MLSNSTTSGLVGYPFLIPYFIQTDSEGIVLDVCEKFDELLSCLHIQDPIGNPALTLFSSIADHIPSLMTEIGEGGFPHSFDIHLKNKSSKTDWIRWLSIPLPAKDGRPSGWQLTGIHVETAACNTRKMTRANLPSQPEEEILSFDSIINSLRGIFYSVEDKGRILRENNTIELNIADDGFGFDPETVKLKEGLGLKNIMSRADLFNGKVTMVAAPQKGCKLSVQIPIDHL
jgi:hypothetical protein